MEMARVVAIMFVIASVAVGMTYWGWLRARSIRGGHKIRIDEEEYQSDHSEIALNVMHDYSSDPRQPGLTTSPVGTPLRLT